MHTLKDPKRLTLSQVLPITIKYYTILRMVSQLILYAAHKDTASRYLPMKSKTHTLIHQELGLISQQKHH